MFLGFFAGAIATFSFFGKKGFDFLKRQIFATKKDLIVFLLMFLIGSSPLITYNIMQHNQTFRYLWHSFWHSTSYGYDNLAFLNNISLRINDFFIILSNSNTPETLYSKINYFHVILFYISFFGVLLYTFFSKRAPISKNKLLFLISAYLILFLLTCFVPQSRSTEHEILMFPFVQIIEGVFIFLVLVFSKKVIFAVGLILLLLCPYVYSEFYTIGRVLADVKNERGRGFNSSIIKEIASYAHNNGISKIFGMSEYLLECNVDFLTNLDVNVRELAEIYPYGGRLDKDHLDDIIKSIYKAEMEGRKQIYIIIWKNGNLKEYSQKAFKAFLKIFLEKMKKISLVEKFISKADGNYFELYVAK